MTLKRKFTDPLLTADGSKRASVELEELKTLWFNTGTICNLSCTNCYIESTPKNDRLSFLTNSDVTDFLDEIQQAGLNTEEIGITGGEPFINPEIIAIAKSCLEKNFKLLILTNAMRPMMKLSRELLDLNCRWREALTLRVSIDHFSPELHEEERGRKTWEPTLEGLKWLSDNGFKINVAGRTRWGEEENTLRDGYHKLFNRNSINIDAYNEAELLLFPEMDTSKPVPEITEECWDILGISPSQMMCASSRMVVKFRGDSQTSVIACTLLPYDEQFNLGTTLRDSKQSVFLNHPHCSKFCVLGGGTCSK